MRGNDGIGDLRSLEGVGGHARPFQCDGGQNRCCLRGETMQRLVWSGANGKHCARQLHPALTTGYAPAPSGCPSRVASTSDDKWSRGAKAIVELGGIVISKRKAQAWILARRVRLHDRNARSGLSFSC